MAKLALGILAFLAVFAVLVLALGSIPAQQTTRAARDQTPTTAGRGHVIRIDERRD
jgi:hypothetical protein